MTRLMFDSTTPWDIPRDAEMVAYYVDGIYTWPQGWIDLFPNAVKVPISAIGRNVAPVGDVEVGCIWPPANAVPWVIRARAAGYDPTIYVNELNDWGPVRHAFRDADVPEPHYWVARYNGVREIPAGAVARQFAHPHDGDGVADRPWETGKHYDLSIVANYWPGIDKGDDDVLNEQRVKVTGAPEGEYEEMADLAIGAAAGNSRTANVKLDALAEKVDRLAEAVSKIATGGVDKEEIKRLAKEAVGEDLKNDEE